MLFTFSVLNFWIVCNEGGKNDLASCITYLFTLEKHLNHFHEILYLLACSSFG